MSDDFKIELTSGDELTDEQKDILMALSIAEYPPYEKYYRVNKYYSVIKPQIIGLILRNDEIVGDGKLLWQNVELPDRHIKLFGFGLTIRKEYQGKGLGTELIKQFMHKAEELGADILYATSDSPVIDHILNKFGFSKLTMPVEYTHALSGEREREEKTAYVYLYNKDILASLEKLSVFYLGQGPI
ncbi:MAG: GNAT family N-acetyltransferase [Candidatus Paceibacterota bacterium]|jgi:GNAT superfamily N-acetyltransferase